MITLDSLRLRAMTFRQAQKCAKKCRKGGNNSSFMPTNSFHTSVWMSLQASQLFILGFLFIRFSGLYYKHVKSIDDKNKWWSQVMKWCHNLQHHSRSITDHCSSSKCFKFSEKKYSNGILKIYSPDLKIQFLRSNFTLQFFIALAPGETMQKVLLILSGSKYQLFYKFARSTKYSYKLLHQ
jgi:hypothetical protein